MHRILLFICLLPLNFCVAQLPQVASGKIVRHPYFKSRFVAPRHVDVWLPSDYSSKKKYAVLYMHDGQMLFDTAATWNKQEWGVDETMGMLLKNNQVPPVIVVGIWNTEDRWLEYFPEKPFNKLPQAWRDSMSEGLQVKKKTAMSDEYLQFMVKELKPFIDSAYSTHKDRSNTYTIGSSMGGLISMYAVCEYPEVFGGAACLSTHWPGGYDMDDMLAGKVFNSYMKMKLPSPAHHRFYFDYGSEGGDKTYDRFQKMIDSTMQQKGYAQNNWLTIRYGGEEHNEKSWAKRLAAPFFFLLKKAPGTSTGLNPPKKRLK
jgi:hypothetical protein